MKLMKNTIAGKKACRLLQRAGGTALALLLAGCGSLPGGASAAPVNPGETPQAADAAIIYGPAAVRVSGPGQRGETPYPPVSAPVANAVLDAEQAKKEMLGFTGQSASAVLSKSDHDKNAAYSPVSLYAALSMLAEGAGGETRAELLKAMGTGNMATARARASLLGERLYFQNEMGTLQSANSVWLNRDLHFETGYTNTLSADYRADSYQVDFKNPGAPGMISDWVSKNTGGRLGNNPEEFRPECTETSDYRPVALLFNALYFKDQWMEAFPAENTADAVFHAEGGDSSVPFMMRRGTASFVQTANYAAAGLRFKNGGEMTFILPEKGKSPYDLLQNPALLAEALSYQGSEEVQRGEVTYRVPKFSFDGATDLVEALNTLGVKRVFDPDTADLTGISSDTSLDLYLSKVVQGTAVSIDEKGCEAAAFTEMAVAGATSLPVGSLDLTLDRPFLFAISSRTGDTLFIGVVNNPSVS